MKLPLIKLDTYTDLQGDKHIVSGVHTCRAPPLDPTFCFPFGLRHPLVSGESSGGGATASARHATFSCAIIVCSVKGGLKCNDGLEIEYQLVHRHAQSDGRVYTRQCGM